MKVFPADDLRLALSGGGEENGIVASSPTCAATSSSMCVAISSSTCNTWCLCKKAAAHLSCSWTGGSIKCSTCGKTLATTTSAVVHPSGSGLAFGTRILAFLGWHRFPHFWSWSWPWPWPGTKDDPDSGPSFPVLLVPGIGGTILHAQDKNGNQERVWVRILGADHEFREKMWSTFDVKSGKTLSLDSETQIVIPEDRHGLFCCDILDPAFHVRFDAVYYFHDLIEEMLTWGYVEGHTLFGFGYDFRQSNRLPETLERLKERLKSINKQAGGKKVNVVTHSMGGLVFKSFLATHKEDFERYVNSWIAVTCPFGGAPGFVMDTLLTGVEFVKGWGRGVFIQKWSFHQLAMECPSIYEMMPPQSFNWEKKPVLNVWRKVTEDSDAKDKEQSNDKKSKLEVYYPNEFEEFLREALEKNVLDTGTNCLPLPLNSHILDIAHETRRLWDNATLPEGFRFFNIIGTSMDTPFDLTYGTEEEPIEKLSEVLQLEVVFGTVDGDGTVPLESAMADGLKAVKRVQMKGEHRGILNDPDLFSKIKDFLNPSYDPEVDAVIIPPAGEVEKEIEKEHWRAPSPHLEEVQEDDSVDGYSESIWSEAIIIDKNEVTASSVTMIIGKVPIANSKDSPLTATEALEKEEPTGRAVDVVSRHSALPSDTIKNLPELSAAAALPEVSISAGFPDVLKHANTNSMVIAAG